MLEAKEGRPRSHIILVADDEEAVRIPLGELLSEEGYLVKMARDGIKAWEIIQNEPVDVVISDIDMPGLDGYSLARKIKGSSASHNIPVVLITGMRGEDVRLEAIESGVDEFLGKPLRPRELSARVRILCEVKDYYDFQDNYRRELENEVRKRTKRLDRALALVEEFSLDTIHRLSRAAEFRDDDTGSHIQRMSRYAELIAVAIGWSQAAVDELRYAAPLHDVGKIGIPDPILLKPGKLEPDEWEIMKQHTIIGAKILGGARSKLLQLAETIALSHHERWDGSGYPYGKRGTDIPEAGRIVSVADVFDALSSARPYKEAFPDEKTFHIMKEGRGTHFDPSMIDAFFDLKDEMLEVRAGLQDDSESPLVSLQRQMGAEL